MIGLGRRAPFAAFLAIPLLFLSSSGLAASTGGCVVPWKVKRVLRESCWVRLGTEKWGGKTHYCVPRKLWQQWLWSPRPICFPEPSESTGVWKQVRRSLFDQSSDGQVKIETAQFTLKSFSSANVYPDSKRLKHRLGLPLTHWLERRRERFSKQLERVDSSGWLRSWFLSEPTPKMIHSEHQETVPARVFFLFGYVHLLTTAGVHLLLLAGALEWAALIAASSSLFCRHRHRIDLAHFFKRTITVLEWILFFWVWALSGWRWGLIRPMALIAIQQFSRRRGVQWQRGVPLIFAVLFEAALATMGGVDAGWGRVHYFLAVWGGVWGSVGRTGWRAHWGMAWGSWIWIVPIQIFEQGWVALSTPILSLVTIPLVGSFIFPLGLILETLPSLTALYDFLGFAAQLLLKLTSPLVRIPGSMWSLSFSSFLIGLGIVSVLRLVFLHQTRKLHFLFFSLIFFIIVLRVILRPLVLESDHSKMSIRASEVLQLDVGQGDSSLVFWKEGHHKKVSAIDVGSKWASSPEQWMIALARRGFTELDSVVLTHADEDHIGALVNILPWVRVRCVVIPSILIQDARMSELVSTLSQYSVWTTHHSLGCFPFPYVLAGNNLRSARVSNGVMAGVLIPMSNGRAYLNLGDAGSRGEASERQLLKILKWEWPEEWQYFARPGTFRILKVSHHGSRTSTSAAFLNEALPTEAWISVGQSNSYGHPHLTVLDRLQRWPFSIRRTDQEGAVISK